MLEILAQLSENSYCKSSFSIGIKWAMKSQFKMLLFHQMESIL